MFVSTKLINIDIIIEIKKVYIYIYCITIEMLGLNEVFHLHIDLQANHLQLFDVIFDFHQLKMSHEMQFLHLLLIHHIFIIYIKIEKIIYLLFLKQNIILPFSNVMCFVG